MNNTYGYILGKYGKDGDHLDMFINDAADLDNWNGTVYVVDQVDPKTGKFDEHKCLYGFDSLEDAKHIEPLEETIDNLCDEMKLHHVQRLQQGTCTILQGFIFNDLLTNFERISDHCSNVAVAMIELSVGSFETHDYIDHLKERSAFMFQEDLKKYEAEYSLPALEKA